VCEGFGQDVRVVVGEDVVDAGVVGRTGGAVGHECEERLEGRRLLGLQLRQKLMMLMLMLMLVLMLQRFVFFVYGRERLGFDGIIGGLSHRSWEG
jgi:hypothetical protein